MTLLVIQRLTVKGSLRRFAPLTVSHRFTFWLGYKQ